MGLRGLGLLLLLALAGGAAGYAYAERASTPVVSGSTPVPLSASDPAAPTTPPQRVKADSELPPLPETLTTRDQPLGEGGEGGIYVPVPLGWSRVDLSDREARWVPPGNPEGSYSVRVAVVDLRRSLSQVVAERAAALRLDRRITDLQLLGDSGDTLRASFILDGYRKLTIVRWLSFDGDGIDVEVAATGRLIDENGLDALVAKLATEVFRQRPFDPRPGQITGQ